MRTENLIVEKHLSLKLNNYDNKYKLVVSINNRPVNTRCFEASCYNPPIRFTLDIKKNIYKYIDFLSNVLTKQKLTLFYSNVDLFKIVSKEELQKHPKSVDMKLSLFLNDDIIIERIEKIQNNFNPLALYSNDLDETMIDIIDSIEKIIHDEDIKFMHETTDLIVNYGFNIKDLKVMSPEVRKEKLEALKSKNFVKQTKIIRKNV